MTVKNGFTVVASQLWLCLVVHHIKGLHPILPPALSKLAHCHGFMQTRLRHSQEVVLACQEEEPELVLKNTSGGSEAPALGPPPSSS